MGPKEENDSKQSPRYVWDSKKLAWVETGGVEEQTSIFAEAAKPEPAAEVKQEPVVSKVIEKINEEKAVTEEVADEEDAKEAEWEERLYYTGVLPRLAAFIIDFLVLAAVGWLITRVTTGAYLWYIYAGVYFIGMWAWRGQTIGKMIIRAKVVKSDGKPVGLVGSVLRFVVFAAYYSIYAYGSLYISTTWTFVILILFLLIIAFQSTKRGIHDLVAGTCVVSYRTTFVQPREFQAPEGSDEDSQS